jgi:hypothetical protein
MRNTLHDTVAGEELPEAAGASAAEKIAHHNPTEKVLVVNEEGKGEERLRVSGNGRDGSVVHLPEGDMKLEDYLALRSQGIDPGAKAREKVLTRGQKVKRAVVRTYILIITAVVLLVAGAAGYGYYEFTKPGKRMVDFRTCSFVDEKLGVEITGKREFSYLERSLFGVHFRLDKDIEQKTIIDIKGDPITVVGINKDGSWWNKFADMGERGVMILPQADQYVFATKKKAPVVGYDQFCR